MAFFSKADAKVRTFFEPPKLFRRNFQKKVFQWRFVTLSLFQYFNSSAFLSRKRVQKYCFTTYPPNIRNTFLQTFCRFSRNSLITKRCRTTYFRTSMHETKDATPYYYNIEACITLSTIPPPFPMLFKIRNFP